MDRQNTKCVMVLDEKLPLGIMINTAAVMGMTFGKRFPDMIGADVSDKTGKLHLGVTEFPISILRGDAPLIRQLREKLYQPEFSGLTAVDFSDVAQSCKTYDEFTGKIANVAETDLNYFGVAICGNKKAINKLTGSMPLLR